MAQAPEKFLPQPTPVTEKFWQGCRDHRLLIQRCPECGHYQFYPRSLCTGCTRPEPDWVESSGFGTVLTWTVVRRPVSAAYVNETPYAIALIQLDEGPVMMSQLACCDPEQVRTGQRVQVRFEAWSESVTMPLFAPCSDRS